MAQGSGARPDSATVPEIARYLVVGALAFGVDYAVFIALWAWMNLDYLLANSAGLFAGMVASYLLNGHYTFKRSSSKRSCSAQGEQQSDRAVTSASDFGRFLAINLLTLVIGNGLMAGFVQLAGLAPTWAKVAVSIMIPCVNFPLYRAFVFRRSG